LFLSDLILVFDFYTKPAGCHVLFVTSFARSVVRRGSSEEQGAPHAGSVTAGGDLASGGALLKSLQR
jgi:hypothetical protein